MIKVRFVGRVFAMHLKNVSHAQAGIDFEAASREQLALEYEADRVRDLLRLAQAPERYG